jgi:hypothetical protein
LQNQFGFNRLFSTIHYALLICPELNVAGDLAAEASRFDLAKMFGVKTS